jgi:hypothetical protein
MRGSGGESANASAPEARTIRMCSLDGRSWRQPIRSRIESGFKKSGVLDWTRAVKANHAFPAVIEW